MKRGLAIVITAAAAAVFWDMALKTKWAMKKAAGMERDLRALCKRVDGLEEGVELLDTRTDSMEYDMKYNVKRIDNFDRYDIDIDDDDY